MSRQLKGNFYLSREALYLARSISADAKLLYVTLVQYACWQNTEFIFNKKKITLNPGDVVTSFNELVTECKMPKSSVHRALKMLSKAELLSVTAGTKCMLISICNYMVYSENGKASGSDLDEVETKVETYKELINNKEKYILLGTPEKICLPNEQNFTTTDFTFEQTTAANTQQVIKPKQKTKSKADIGAIDEFKEIDYILVNVKHSVQKEFIKQYKDIPLIISEIRKCYSFHETKNGTLQGFPRRLVSWMGNSYEMQRLSKLSQTQTSTVQSPIEFKVEEDPSITEFFSNKAGG